MIMLTPCPYDPIRRFGGGTEVGTEPFALHDTYCWDVQMPGLCPSTVRAFGGHCGNTGNIPVSALTFSQKGLANIYS